ncbi:hypothetical protein CHS0354_020326 [Potamilus streckersoni]|uniref:Uncharacterized protein n=1 Tax=Potamilus streckersoni TaxID=2493646 RepID=A0AAE0SFY2_9BIVA|nr:hypothetical protein CHS0354_020326 [Potamilus streckersoni]
MHFLGIRNIFPEQAVSTLVILGLAMNCISVLAHRCQKNEYFDPHTGNCDPCAPLCAVMNCSKICPDLCQKDEYFDSNTGNCDKCAPLCEVTNCSKICPDFVIDNSSSAPAKVSSFGRGSVIDNFIIITVASICSALAIALLGFFIFQKFSGKRMKWCSSGITATSVRETGQNRKEDDKEKAALILNRDTCDIL